MLAHDRLDRFARPTARMLSQSSTAQRPSFSRTWSEPVPALSSPQSVTRPASSRLPKNFQPVGVSKHCDAELRRDPVGGAARRHRARDAAQALGIAGSQMGVGREHGEAVARRHEEARPHDHVAVAVAVARRRRNRARRRPYIAPSAHWHGPGSDRDDGRRNRAAASPFTTRARRRAEALFEDLLRHRGR